VASEHHVILMRFTAENAVRKERAAEEAGYLRRPSLFALRSSAVKRLEALNPRLL